MCVCVCVLTVTMGPGTISCSIQHREGVIKGLRVSKITIYRYFGPIQ